MGSVISEGEGIMAADGQDQAAAKAALNETLKEYINEWRKTREKEEEELKKLKQQKKEEEEKLRKDENEKKAKEAEEKEKRLEEAEAKRQEMLEAQKADKAGAGGAKKAGGGGGDARREMTKTKEQLNIVIALETDKYDYEQRRITQDYELNELKERQKAQLRQKALKKGLDPEAFSGKYPPPIRMYSKYERRTDTRTYEDRKKLYEGGWEVIRAESLDAI